MSVLVYTSNFRFVQCSSTQLKIRSLTSLSIVRISLDAKKFDEIRRLNKALVLCHSELRKADIKPAEHESYLLSKNALVTIGVSKSPLPHRVLRRFESFCSRLPFSPGTRIPKNVAGQDDLAYANAHQWFIRSACR